MDFLPGAKLFRLIGKLLVVLQALRGIRHVIANGPLRFLRGQCRHAIAVKEAHVIEVRAVGEGVLGEDDVRGSVAALVQQRGNKAARVSAAYINHVGPEGIQHRIAVIQ